MKHRHRRPRRRRLAQQFEPVGQRNASGATEQKARQVEARYGGGAIIADQRQCKPNADQAERHIQEEDPTPAEVCGDGPADRRSQHRRDQARQGDIGDEAYEVALFGRTQHHQSSHRQHHGAAGSLQDPAGYKAPLPLAEPAQHRGAGEYRDRGGKHAPCAEAIRHPAADRNEDGQSERVGQLRRCSN